MDMGVAYQGHQVDGVKILQAANDLLLFRRHEEVLRICKLGVDRSQEVVFPDLAEEVLGMRREEGGDARRGVSEESDPHLRQIQREAMRYCYDGMGSFIYSLGLQPGAQVVLSRNWPRPNCHGDY